MKRSRTRSIDPPVPTPEVGDSPTTERRSRRAAMLLPAWALWLASCAGPVPSDDPTDPISGTWSLRWLVRDTVVTGTLVLDARTGGGTWNTIGRQLWNPCADQTYPVTITGGTGNTRELVVEPAKAVPGCGSFRVRMVASPDGRAVLRFLPGTNTAEAVRTR